MPQKSLEALLVDRSLPKITNPAAMQAIRDALPEPEMPVPPQFDDNGKLITPGKPSHAAPFRQEPMVIGSPNIAVTVDKLLRLVPSLRGGPVKKVTGGPNEDTITQMYSSRLPIDLFEGTTLDGITNIETRNIGLSRPNLGTTLHEFGHGHKDMSEAEAQTLEELLARATSDLPVLRGSYLQKALPKLNIGSLRVLLGLNPDE